MGNSLSEEEPTERWSAAMRLLFSFFSSKNVQMEDSEIYNNKVERECVLYIKEKKRVL